MYREARAAIPGATPGVVLASRSLIVGPSKAAAAEAARQFLEKTFNQLPKDVQARIDYLQMVAEQILRPVGATPP